MKSFESIGLWFLPSDPDTQVAGTIVFSTSDGIHLRLSGSFQTNWNIGNAQYHIIQGVVSESPYGRFVTLFGCFATNLRFGMPGISLETIHANHAFAGNDFVTSEDSTFDSADLYFSGLAGWLGYTGIKFDPMTSPKSMQASWKAPDELIAHAGGAKISAAFECSSHGEILPRSFTIEETPALEIDDFGTATAADIHSRFVSPLYRLFAFASDNTSELDQYRLSVRRPDQLTPGHFYRLYSPSTSPNKSKSKTAKELLFSLADVPEGFEAFLHSWFNFVESHPKFCAMFFSYGYERHGFLETRFLFQMLSAECLVREENPSAETIGEFKAIRDIYFEHDPLLLHEPFAKLGIPSTMQMAMPTLFAAFLKRHWPIVGELVGTTVENFVHTLFITLQHVIQRGDPVENVVSGVKLYWLLARLAAIQKVCVLHLLGFGDNKIKELVFANEEMGQLREKKEPWT